MRSDKDRPHPSRLASPEGPCKRPGNIDDVVTGSRRVLLVPGNPKPDPEIDRPNLLQNDVAIGKLSRPFRSEADTETGRYQRRAVDANGCVLDALLRSRRNKAAALKLMRKLLKHQGTAPRVTVTDKLHSYSTAKSQLMPGVEHRSHKGLNNRAENS